MRSAVKSGYGQDCPVARTLDIVGERWTFLILRDLLRQGARKFQDLEAKSRRHRSQHAVGAVEKARRGGDRRATVLRAASAARRVRFDTEGTGTWAGSAGPEKMGRDVLGPEDLMKNSMIWLPPPVWAPIYVLIVAAISWSLGWPKIPGLPLAVLGIALVVGALILPVWAIFLFRREGTLGRRRKVRIK